MSLRPGLYERLIDREVQTWLKALAQKGVESLKESPPEAEVPLLYARYLLPIVRQAVAEIREDRLERGRELVNSLVGEIARFMGDETWEQALLPSPAELLLEVPDPEAPRQGEGLLEGISSESLRPLTGISEHTLLTGAVADPRLAHELEAEILSASRIDWMVSFLRWSGLRLLLPALEGAARRGIPLRVITTTYMKATEARCLEALSEIPGARVRVSLDDTETRLHAKAYLFPRETGYSTAYVGSSNASRTALSTGHEWNLKIAATLSPDLWDKMVASFESFWNRPELVEYGEVTRSLIRQRLEEGREPSPLLFKGLSLSPYPFQEEILEKLAVEREVHGRTKNLVVAATGTGKTVIAALDFRRLREKMPRARLLFVAHRREILEQSLLTFRRALGDPNFGRILLPDGSPGGSEHLFVSIQLLASRSLLDSLSPDYFDVVVVDEVHHGEAPTYRRLLSRLSPRILLGLTATPERSDGLDIRSWFDGRIAAEIRLPEAIGRGLLVPFHYFGVSDSVDYRSVRWERGRYNLSDLDKVITGDDLRAGIILKAVSNYLADPRKARGLGFCVSVNHAIRMAEIFNRAGLPSEALHAGTPSDRRERVRARLAKGELSFLFTVDLFNEGVDIPEVDTVLFLRPTDSLTVFLQQLGRGLRLFPGKEVLTVLDFIGQSRAEFAFEPRFRALLGATRQSVGREMEAGFPFLPPGCAIRLEPVAKEIVLDNIRRSLSSRRSDLRDRLARWPAEHDLPLTLANFLETTGLSLTDLYKKEGGGGCAGFARLKADAGVGPDFSSPDEGRLTQGIARLSHVEGGRYRQFLERVVRGELPEEDRMSEEDRRFFLMLHYSLWGKRTPLSLGQESVTDSARELLRVPPLLEELREVLDYRTKGQSRKITPIALPGGAPLDLHGSYLLLEILAAFGRANFSECREVREGVLYLPEHRTDLFFVTLRKSPKDYSPSTLYKDYAVSETLFHWQSQNRTTPESPTGQRYIRHQEEGVTPLLFVRTQEKGPEMPLGLSSPYLFLGPVRYVRHEGSRPVSILWHLESPMPPALFEASAAAVG